MLMKKISDAFQSPEQVNEICLSFIQFNTVYLESRYNFYHILEYILN